MSTTETPALTLMQQQAAGLRALADMIEQHPELADVCSPSDLFVFHATTAAQQAAVARAALAHGAKVSKQVGKETYTLNLQFGVITASSIAWRNEVCERVVTGTETVTRTVPDPAALAEVPEIEVTETVETEEWVCKPLLAATSEVAPATVGA